LEKKRILVVEDQGIVALDIQGRLMSLGYDVPAIASLGDEAIRQAETLRADLVLMDVRLEGESDGIMAAEQIRDRLDIPVVFLTAYSDDATLQRAKIAESFGYLVKPFKEEDLRATIEIALHKHKMERRLRESERLLKMTFASMLDAVFIIGADNATIADCNPAASQMFGYTSEEMVGRAVDMLHVDEAALAEFREHLYQAVEEKGFLYLPSFEMKRKDGAIFPAEHSMMPLEDERGDRFGWVSVVHDITKRVRAEKALRESEIKYRELFELSPESITLIDLDSTIIDCNAATTDLSGLTRDEMIGKPFLELSVLHKDEMPKAAQIFQHLSNGDKIDPIELRASSSGNRLRWIEAFPVLLKREGLAYAVQVITRDITERKQIEEELRRRNEGLSALNAISAAAVSSLELDTVLRQILERTCYALNAAAGSILLYDSATEELFFAMSLVEDQARMLRPVRLKSDQGIAGWVADHGQPVRVDDVRGDPRWYPEVDAVTGFETRSLLCAPMMHRDETVGVIEIINKTEGAFGDDDLSLLVAMASIAAAALQNTRLYAASQSRIQELTLLNEIGLTVTSSLDSEQIVQAAFSLMQHLFPADGIFLFQPEAAGLSVTHALTKKDPDQSPPSLSPGEGIAGWVLERRQPALVNNVQTDPRYSTRLDPYLAGRQVAAMAVPLLVPDGVIGVLLVANWRTDPYTPQDLRVLQAVASTLTAALENARLYNEQQQLLREREQTQVQLIHSEKMSALGRLAASMAHEINNPLQAIQGCLTLTEEELSDQRRQEKLTRYLGVIGSEIERIAELVRRMRGFYRPARDGRVPTDLHEVLESVLELSRKQLQKSNVSVKCKWAQNAPMVQANPDHLKQVFLNLVLNAIDAMPEGGTLRIIGASDQLQHDGSPPCPAVRVELSDTGIGMSREVESRLFEPFFTTKDHGSGLGLSTIYGIVQSHGGQIIVHSREGLGTSFSILLPAALDRPVTLVTT
jgi:two-component system NtrC family sensor kinase